MCLPNNLYYKIKSMLVNLKQMFINHAIENGYDNNGTNGWDWIKDNLKELDYIFQSEHYKEQNGMKFKCMPFLVGDMGNDDMPELETRVLETAWYLNNQRVSEQAQIDKIKKLNEMGFFNIENDEKLDKRKCEFIKDTTGDMFGGLNKFVGKLSWSKIDKRLMAMKSKNRRRGWWIDKDIYVKFI